MSQIEPRPEELYKWGRSWPRWYGTPEDVARVAKKIDEAVRRSLLFETVFTQLDWGTPVRATGSYDIEVFARDLRANRRALTSARIHVLAIEKGSRYPTDLEDWPTKMFERPIRPFSSEVVSAPVLIELQLSAWEGARLKVLTKSGLHGERLYHDIEPYVASGAGKLPPAFIYRRPVEWLLPRFELVEHSRRWIRFSGAIVSGISLVGGVIAIATAVTG